MHDRTGKPLAKGDHVTILAEITDVSATPDFCNVTVKTSYGRRPDGNKETISAINTAVMDKFTPDCSAPVAFGLPNTAFPGIDTTLLREKVPSIAAHIGGIAVDLAACTKNPFDDMVAAQLPSILENLLLKFLPTDGPPVMMSSANFEASAEGAITSAVESHGKIITPERLAMLVALLKMFFPILPFAPK